MFILDTRTHCIVLQRREDDTLPLSPLSFSLPSHLYPVYRLLRWIFRLLRPNQAWNLLYSPSRKCTVEEWDERDSLCLYSHYAMLNQIGIHRPAAKLRLPHPKISATREGYSQSTCLIRTEKWPMPLLRVKPWLGLWIDVSVLSCSWNIENWWENPDFFLIFTNPLYIASGWCCN